MSRVRITLFVLSAMALVTVVGANGAWAEIGSKWLVLTSGGVTKTAEELTAALRGELGEGKEVLLTTILGIKVEKTCTAVTLIGMSLEGEGHITSGGRLKFTGCRVFLNKEESPECAVHSAGAPVGTVETAQLSGDLGLHLLEKKVDGPIRIEPKTGTAFVTLEMGVGCPIGNKVPITGILYGEDSEGKLETHQIKHSMVEGPGSTTKILGNPMTLDGSVSLSLSGAHANLKWGGMLG